MLVYRARNARRLKATSAQNAPPAAKVKARVLPAGISTSFLMSIFAPSFSVENVSYLFLRGFRCRFTAASLPHASAGALSRSQSMTAPKLSIGSM